MINITDLPLALGEVLLDLSAHRLMNVLVQCCITGNPGKNNKKKTRKMNPSLPSNEIQVSHLAVLLPRKAKALKPLGRSQNRTGSGRISNAFCHEKTFNSCSAEQLFCPAMQV